MAPDRTNALISDVQTMLKDPRAAPIVAGFNHRMRELCGVLDEWTLSISDIMQRCAMNEAQLYGGLEYIKLQLKGLGAVPTAAPVAPPVPSVAPTAAPSAPVFKSKPTPPKSAPHTPSAGGGSEHPLKAYIPQIEKYHPRRVHGTTDVKIVTAKYQNRNDPREEKPFLLITGATGAGKTHLLRHVAATLRVPYMRVNLNGATTPDDLLGQFMPNDDPNSDARYKWCDGVLTRFMRHGGLFVVDEINMSAADILAIFNSVTDKERRAVLVNKDGESITAHPDFYIAATCNEGYEGTRPLNAALVSRFSVLNLEYSGTVEKALKLSPEVLRIAEMLRESGKVRSDINTRDLIALDRGRALYGDAVSIGFFVAGFPQHERQLIREVIKNHIDDGGASVPQLETDTGADGGSE